MWIRDSPGPAPRPWSTGSAFDQLDWAPQGEVLGSYRVTLDEPGMAFEAECIHDADGDGHDHPDDSNDANWAIHPGAYEYPWDGIDSNCTGEDESSAVISSYTGGGHTIYRMAETDAETRHPVDREWDQGVCEAVGLRPVSCEWEGRTPERFYNSEPWNGVGLNDSHYGCNLTYGIEDLTGWTLSLLHI